jgi:hypothetical protein
MGVTRAFGNLLLETPTPVCCLSAVRDTTTLRLKSVPRDSLNEKLHYIAQRRFAVRFIYADITPEITNKPRTNNSTAAW